MHASGRRSWSAARQAPGTDRAMEPRAGLHSSPELSRAKRLTVGELCSLFEARCAAVAAAAARQLPDRPKRGCRPPNGVLPPVIPRLTVTAEESEEAQGSPQARSPRPEGGGLRTGSSLHLQSRRLSNSSVSSTGSSSLLEDSEDDVLSDTECRSQGIVHLEHGEDTSQVGVRGEWFARDALPAPRPSLAGQLGASRAPQGPPDAPAWSEVSVTQLHANSGKLLSWPGSSALRRTGCCACWKRASARGLLKNPARCALFLFAVYLYFMSQEYREMFFDHKCFVFFSFFQSPVSDAQNKIFPGISQQVFFVSFSPGVCDCQFLSRVLL